MGGGGVILKKTFAPVANVAQGNSFVVLVWCFLSRLSFIFCVTGIEVVDYTFLFIVNKME